MVAIKKTRTAAVARKDILLSPELPSELPVVESLTPAVIDLLARVVIDAQQKELAPYAEIVKAHQEALLRALNRNSGTRNDS